MQCNIDRGGRLLRTSLGVGTVVAGILLVAANRLGWLPGWSLPAGIAALLGGGFMIFEGLNGWCVVRAMGFKTPI
ncbi:MAG: hypothetical protein ACK6CT_10280 [Planctomycetia bacterium]|jgi:hypothetical protein